MRHNRTQDIGSSDGIVFEQHCELGALMLSTSLQVCKNTTAAVCVGCWQTFLTEIFLQNKCRLKFWAFIYRCLQGNQNSSGLQIEVVYWPALEVDSAAAQLAATHCCNKRTLDPQSAARQTHLCQGQPHSGLHPIIIPGL